MRARIRTRKKGRVSILPLAEVTSEDKLELARLLRNIAGVKRAYVRTEGLYLRINTGRKGTLREIRRLVNSFKTEAMKVFQAAARRKTPRTTHRPKPETVRRTPAGSCLAFQVYGA